MKVVGRVVFYGHGSRSLTMENASDCYRIRQGARFVLSVDSHGEQRRVGDHQVQRIDHEAGVIYAWDDVRSVSCAAASYDYILTAEEDPKWSPYP